VEKQKDVARFVPVKIVSASIFVFNGLSAVTEVGSFPHFPLADV
jgi:hypothetical protein